MPADLELPVPVFKGGIELSKHEVLNTIETLKNESYYTKNRVKKLKSGSKEYSEKIPVGVVCETINLFPSDSEAIKAAFAANKMNAAAMFKWLSFQLEELWKKNHPDVPFGCVMWHTNENVIHAHVWHAGTTADHKRITNSTGKGRPKGKNIGPGDIATLRCAKRNFPVVPQQLAYAQAAAKLCTHSADSPQYTVSASGLLDNCMAKVKTNPQFTEFFNSAEKTYREYRADKVSNSKFALQDKIEDLSTQLYVANDQVKFLESQLTSRMPMDIAAPKNPVKQLPRKLGEKHDIV
jgi:hypothetical protein